MEQLAPPTPSSPRRYTPAEYRRICDSTEQLLDYWDGIITDRAGNPIQFNVAGEVLDMAGATPDHGRIASNLSREVGNRLKGGPCETLDASVKIRLGSSKKNAHPDVTVCCDGVQLDEESDRSPVILNPRLVFEVLSPMTLNYDTTKKADGYRAIESLQEYVFVWQNEPRVQAQWRETDGGWVIGDVATGLSGSVRLRSIGVELPLAEVYARVTFPPEATVADAS